MLVIQNFHQRHLYQHYLILNILLSLVAVEQRDTTVLAAVERVDSEQMLLVQHLAETAVPRLHSLLPAPPLLRSPLVLVELEVDQPMAVKLVCSGATLFSVP